MTNPDRNFPIGHNTLAAMAIHVLTSQPQPAVIAEGAGAFRPLNAAAG